MREMREKNFVRRRILLVLAAALPYLVALSCARPEAPADPAITRVQPSCGPADGGNRITVTGREFEEGMQIRLGSERLDTTFVDATRLEAVAPADEIGSVVPVAILNAEGGVEAAMVSAYRYRDRSTFDPNGDCDVSIADVHYLANHLLGEGEPPVLSGDADGNGNVDRADLDYLINHLLADGPPPVGQSGVGGRE
jgi:hypothetical protein